MPNPSETRRYDYVHVLLLVERFRPISSLPVNQRVIQQINQTINIQPINDDFLKTIDYTHVMQRVVDGDDEKQAANQTTHPSLDDLHKAACVASLEVGLKQSITLIKKRFGPKSTINQKSSISDNYLHEWSINPEDQTIKSINSPNKQAVNSTYFLLHDLIKRSQANQSRISEAQAKINQSITQKKPVIRLDYLDLNEDIVPLQDLYKLSHNQTHNQSINEINLSHNSFLYFPLEFCNNFGQLTKLDLSNNKSIYHLPAEVGTKLRSLQSINLIDCKNLISLPLTLPNLTRLTSLELFGCVALAFPPHAACVKAQIATQEGNSPAGVKAMLDYIADPLSFVDFSLLGAKKNFKAGPVDRVNISCPCFRQAWKESYIEYELLIEFRAVSWTIWRRYSQVLKFADELKDLMEPTAWANMHQLPGKSWSLHEDSEEICQERLQAINQLFCQLSDQDGKILEQQIKGWKPLIKQSVVKTFFEFDKHVQGMEVTDSSSKESALDAITSSITKGFTSGFQSIKQLID